MLQELIQDLLCSILEAEDLSNSSVKSISYNFSRKFSVFILTALLGCVKLSV